MPRPIPKVTLVEVIDSPRRPSEKKVFEIVKVENSVRWSVGEEVGEAEIRSALSTGAIRTTLIRRKS